MLALAPCPPPSCLSSPQRGTRCLAAKGAGSLEPGRPGGPGWSRHLTLSLSGATLSLGASGSSSTKWGPSLGPPSHPPSGRLSGAEAGQKRCHGYACWSQTGWVQIRPLVRSNQATGGKTLDLGLPHLCAFNSLFPGVGLLPVGDQEGAVSCTVCGVQPCPAWGG